PSGAPEPVAQVRPTAEQYADDEVVRDGEQPPLHQHQATRQLARVVDLQPGRIVRYVAQREWRVAIGAQRAVPVVAHPPGPPQHTRGEVEDRSRIAAGEQDGEE